MRFLYFTLTPLCIFLFSVIHSDAPEIIRFNFTSSELKILPGNSGEKNKGYGCNGVLKDEDQIGDFAIASEFHQNACYCDENFSNKNYTVELGSVASTDGSQTFVAVRVHPPASTAAKFLASKHLGFVRAKEMMGVYELDDGLLSKAFKTSKKGGLTGGFLRIENFYLSNLDRPRVYVFIPLSAKFSPYSPMGGGVEAARIFNDGNFVLEKYRIPVKGNIFNGNRDFNNGPGSYGGVYGHNRTYFMSPQPDGIAVVWQDQKSDEVFATFIKNNFTAHRQVKLAHERNFLLAAATVDDKGNVYHLMIERSRDASTFATRRVTAFKANAQGRGNRRMTLNGGQSELNIAEFNPDKSCSMAYSNGKLGILISRQMHRSGDGLNHQGAIAFVLDAETLHLDKNFGQTSGHSFGNVTTVDSDGNFLAVDLGDNYPRGVNLHRFNGTEKVSRLFFSVKTQHGTDARSNAGKGYPIYKEISGGGKTYYQWSNDTNTYAEIGGVDEMQNGIALVFAGEPNSSGYALDNSRVGAILNDARNVGFIFVKKNFTEADAVLSKGINEKGGFYTFGGTFAPQENKGVVWLTRYRDVENQNATRVKTARLDGNRLLVLHEIWNRRGYGSSVLSILQTDKGKLEKSINIGALMPLGWRDDLIVKEGFVYAVTGNGVDDKLEIIQIEVK